MLKPVVVSNASHVPGLPHAHGRNGGAILTISSGQFLSEVEGVAHGTAIPTGEHFAPLAENPRHELDGAIEVGENLLIAEDEVEKFVGIEEGPFNALCQDEMNSLRVAWISALG